MGCQSSLPVAPSHAPVSIVTIPHAGYGQQSFPGQPSIQYVGQRVHGGVSVITIPSGGYAGQQVQYSSPMRGQPGAASVSVISIPPAGYAAPPPGFAPVSPPRGYAPMTPPPGYAPLPPRQGYAPNPPPHGYAPMPSPPSFGALPPQHGHGAPQPQSTTAPQSPPGMQQRAPSWHDTPALQVAGGPKTVNAPAMPAPVPQAVNEDPIAPLAPQQTGPPIPAPVISETGLEPLLLLSTSESMNGPAWGGFGAPSKRDVVYEALARLVPRVAQLGAQARKEESGGSLRTVTCAGGATEDWEDLNAVSLAEKWNRMRWIGATTLLPGWRRVQDIFVEEFGARPAAERPLLTCLVVADSEASDHDVFAPAMAALPPGACVAFAVIGFGPAYEAALRYFAGVAALQPRCRLFPLGGHTTEQLSDALLSLTRTHW